MFGNRLTRVLATATAALALSSCAAGSGGAPPAQAAPPQANSNADFDGTFLAGTAAGNGAAPGTGDLAPPREQRSPVARRWVQISADPADRASGPLRNGAGRALYFFTGDTPSAGASACAGACAETWPPVVVDPRGTVFLDRVPEQAVGHFVRTDGLTQLTVAGRPVYRYAGDTGDGRARGHGLDGAWFAAAPSGQAARLDPDGRDTATADASPGTYPSGGAR
ncbi:hypothetical protein [Streptomyces sp. NPDC047097]|uniref:COG4315 family predicted lipoprotein n=1 Tax=Streptomyces sp. NPDC047097 TaxID=3155260 RepID=UPI0033C8B15A